MLSAATVWSSPRLPSELDGSMTVTMPSRKVCAAHMCRCIICDGKGWAKNFSPAVIP